MPLQLSRQKTSRQTRGFEPKLEVVARFERRMFAVQNEDVTSVPSEQMKHGNFFVLPG